jgi:DNA-binding Lrp family transcriptional regulator
LDEQEEHGLREAILVTAACGSTGLPGLLVFVDIFVEQPEMDNVVAALSKLENLVDLYEVTGEFDIVTLIDVDNLDEFKQVLHERIMKIRGVRSTVSSIVLKAHKGPN